MKKERTNEAVWLDKEERWMIQIQNNGIRRRFYSSLPGKKGKKEAEQKADDWIDGTEYVLMPIVKKDKKKSKTVEEVFGEFLDDMRANDYQTKQYEGYARRNIFPSIGELPIDSVCEYDLQMILTNGYRHGYAKKTLQNIRGCMTSFLRFSRSKGYTTLRPEWLRVNKKAPVGTKRTLQPDELRKLFSSSATEWYGEPVKDWYIYMYRFIVATGIRPGEACGLRRTDIKDDGTVSVSGSYNVYGQMTTGKNENAIRTFKANEEAMQAWKEQRKMLMDEGIVSEWAFPRRDNGDITTQKKLYVAWRVYQKYNHIEKTSLYELRHTYVSINKRMPDELLKSQVGHSVSMRTKDIYSHEMAGEREEAALFSTKAFDDILYGK